MLAHGRTPVAAYAIAIAVGVTVTGASAEPTLSVSSSAAKVEHLEKAPPIEDHSDLTTPSVEFEAKWRGLSAGCSYLQPKKDLVSASGSVDVVFHFHAGMMSEKQFRESGLNAVFVSCGFGIGSGAYSDVFSDTSRFGWMTAQLVKGLEQSSGKKVHLRHVALAAWSAGFAAVGKILSVPRYYDMVDTVVLLDGFHSKYKDPNPHTALQGKDHVDLGMLTSFIKFATEAKAGKKTMLMTHSSIITPDYPTAAEATGAMLDAISVSTAPADETNATGMKLYYKADEGNLHVRGFRGQGPRDHFKHLYLIGEVLRSWVVPRWKPDVYTVASE